jgi:hypothetical protein
MEALKQAMRVYCAISQLFLEYGFSASRRSSLAKTDFYPYAEQHLVGLKILLQVIYMAFQPTCMNYLCVLVQNLEPMVYPVKCISHEIRRSRPPSFIFLISSRLTPSGWGTRKI